MAYLALRDPARCRVYDEHGYGALVKAEAYAEDDVFDADPWDVYDRFFAGEDEEDRQYLLLHGGGAQTTIRTARAPIPITARANRTTTTTTRWWRRRWCRRGTRGSRRSMKGAVNWRTARESPPPRPPVSVLMAMGDKAAGARSSAGDDDALPGLEGGDIWAALAKRYETDPVGEKRKRDDEEEEQGDAE